MGGVLWEQMGFGGDRWRQRKWWKCGIRNMIGLGDYVRLWEDRWIDSFALVLLYQLCHVCHAYSEHCCVLRVYKFWDSLILISKFPFVSPRSTWLRCSVWLIPTSCCGFRMILFSVKYLFNFFEAVLIRCTKHICNLKLLLVEKVIQLNATIQILCSSCPRET